MATLLSDPWEWLALVGVVLFNASLVPQLVRTLQLRRAQDVSALFIVMVILASACLMVYLLRQRLWIAGLGYIGNFIVWGIVLYYRLYPKPEKAHPPKH